MAIQGIRLEDSECAHLERSLALPPLGRSEAVAPFAALVPLFAALSLLASPVDATAAPFTFSQDLFTVSNGSAVVQIQLEDLDAGTQSFDLVLSGTTESGFGTDDPYDFVSLFGIAFNQAGLAPQIGDVLVVSSALGSSGPNGTTWVAASAGQPQIQVGLSDLAGQLWSASFEVRVTQLAGDYVFFPFGGTLDGCSPGGGCVGGDGTQANGETFSILAVPEPGSALLVGLGLAALGTRGRRQAGRDR